MELQRQNKTKEIVKKSIEEKAAQLAIMKERTSGLEDSLNSTKPLYDLNTEEVELKKKIEQDQAIIDDQTASPSDREDARERVEENQQELAHLQTQIAEREASLPLRERVKEIFQNYGVTVTAIFLATGVTIGAVVSAIANSLKALGKGLENGLKEIGKKPLCFCPA